MGAWHAQWAWTGEQLAAGVLLEDASGTLTAVETDVAPPAGARHLPGLTLPGLVNTHSHAFHRALRARSQSNGTFWTWRDGMYAVARDLSPESYRALARACYAEMALAGITTVGEFHYLHHDPAGRPYADPNAMAEALRDAAQDAGVRLTLLDTAYLQASVDGRPVEGAQHRFADADIYQWAARVEALAAAWEGADRAGGADGHVADARVGVAIHSVRAVDPDSMLVVAELARARGIAVHVHVSEQPAENDACLASYGCTPTELLAETGVLEGGACAVHATQVTLDDLALLGANDSTICLCPTTERDLADGVGPAREMVANGSSLALGSDSHAVIDLFEEARAVDLDERLVTGVRGGWAADELLAAATRQGAAATGWPDAGVLAPGRVADFITLDLTSVRLAGLAPSELLAGVVYAGSAADVTDVVVGGREVVRDRTHTRVPDVPAALADALAVATQ